MIGETFTVSDIPVGDELAGPLLKPLVCPGEPQEGYPTVADYPDHCRPALRWLSQSLRQVGPVPLHQVELGSSEQDGLLLRPERWFSCSGLET